MLTTLKYQAMANTPTPACRLDYNIPTLASRLDPSTHPTHTCPILRKPMMIIETKPEH